MLDTLTMNLDDSKFKLSSYTRVLRLAKTPGWDEFSRIALITFVGSALIGIIGLIVFFIMNIPSLL